MSPSTRLERTPVSLLEAREASAVRALAEMVAKPSPFLSAQPVVCRTRHCQLRVRAGELVLELLR